MLVTFEPLLRFYFYKILDRSELNFLLIDHLSTCLPVTTRQKITTWGFCQKWLALELPGLPTENLSREPQSVVP